MVCRFSIVWCRSRADYACLAPASLSFDGLCVDMCNRYYVACFLTLHPPSSGCCLWLLAFCVFHLFKVDHALFIATVHCSSVLLKPRAREKHRPCFINQRQRTSCTRVSAIMFRASRETFSIIWFGCVDFSILFILFLFSFSLLLIISLSSALAL